MLIIHHFDLLCPDRLETGKTFSNEARIKYTVESVMRAHSVFLYVLSRKQRACIVLVVSEGWSALDWDK